MNTFYLLTHLLINEALPNQNSGVLTRFKQTLLIVFNIGEYRGLTSIILNYNKSPRVPSVIPKQERETGIEKENFAHS
jgi:hypothetical protein